MGGGQKRWNIGCYLGGKIIVDDELFGTVCFVNKQPREKAFTHDEKVFADLIVRWVSHLYERRRREQRLRETRDRLEAIIEASPAAIIAIDTSGTVEFWNAAAESIFGWSAEEVRGGELPIIPPDRVDEYEKQRTKLLEGKSIKRVETKRQQKDGTLIDVSLSLAPIRHESGEFVGEMGVIENITERKQREQELKRTKEMLEQSQRLAEIGAWELFVNDGIPGDGLWTDEVYRIYNLPRDTQMAVEEVIEFFHPDDQERVAAAVEQAVEKGEPYEFEARLQPRNERERCVQCIGKPIYTDGEVTSIRGSIQDITDRKQREQELERIKTLLDQTERLANVGGWEVTQHDKCPLAGTQTDGLYAIHELSPEEPFPVERHTEFVHPADRDRVQERYDDLLKNGTPFDFETRIVTADNRKRWVRSLGVPVIENGETVAHRGAMVDITDRKEYEQALTSLHEMARELLTTKNEQSVAELVAETATDILDTAAVGIYQLDAEAGELKPTTITQAFRDMFGDEPSPSVGDLDSPLWQAFATEEKQTFDLPKSTSSSTAASTSGLVVPLGEFGVFVLCSDLSPPQQLIETLAATAETAFARFSSEAALKERDKELKAQNERLEREIQINQIIRLIDQSIIDASSQQEIETAVCERLVESTEISFAWIGSLTPDGTQLEPRIWAGTQDGYLDAVELTEGTTEPSWLTATAETGSTLPNVLKQLQDSDWATEALSRNFYSVVSVPITFDEYTYGVLSVYADEPNAFLERECSVFEELGENIAHSINWVHTKQALAGETVTELELTVDSSETFLGRLAQRAGCQTTFEGRAANGDDGTRIFVSTADSAADAVESALAEMVSVTDSTLLTESADSCLFGVTVIAPCVAEKLFRHGGNTQLVQADSQETTIVVTLPKTTDVRELLELLRAQYPTIELAARRDVDQPTNHEGPAALLSELTDRQHEVLRTAYHAGFFETPRTSSADAIAQMLDISQPTVSRHLKRGQQRLFSQLYD